LGGGRGGGGVGGEGKAYIQVTLVSTMYNHFKFGWHYIHECDVLIEREKALSFNFIKNDHMLQLAVVGRPFSRS